MDKALRSYSPLYRNKYMITVFPNGDLYYDNKKYNCVLGKNGIKKEKIEGDGSTPAGIFSLGPLYYRSDRIKNIRSFFKPIPIKPNMFWSDHPDSKYYNQLLNFKDISCESLYKKDNIYDLILVINYNINPVVKNKGSAIFLHILKNDCSPTEGCIALQEQSLIELLRNVKTSDKINILLQE